MFSGNDESNDVSDDISDDDGSDDWLKTIIKILLYKKIVYTYRLLLN